MDVALTVAAVVVLAATTAAAMSLIVVSSWWAFLSPGHLGLAMLVPRWPVKEINLLVAMGFVGVASPCLLVSLA